MQGYPILSDIGEEGVCGNSSYFLCMKTLAPYDAKMAAIGKCSSQIGTVCELYQGKKWFVGQL